MANKKVLLMSNNPLRKDNANGLTLINLFSSFDKNNLASFFVSSSIPDKDWAITNFRITDKECLKNHFKKRSIGKVVEPVLNSKTVFPKKRRKSHNSAFFRLIREYLWKHHRWNKQNLYKWIEGFAPDEIVIMVGRSIFMLNLANEISIKYGIPIIVYASEDEYFHKVSWWKFFERIFLAKLKKAYNKMFLNTKHIIANHEMLAKQYENAFPNVEVSINMQSTNLKDMKNRCDNLSKNFLYTGKLSVGRESTICEIAKTLFTNNIDATIDIFGVNKNENVNKRLVKFSNINVCGIVSYDALKEKRDTARVVLHVESFRMKYMNSIKNSFSTKIPDCLASGVPFLLCAPRGTASAEYAKQNEDAICYVEDLSRLPDALNKILNNEEYRRSLVKNAMKLAKKNHDVTMNSDAFLRIMDSLD